MGLLSSLSREQKEAIGLLQIGTFLEYFDLMLYVHMAVLLNELFFPQTDPHTASLLAAFAFCSTFVFRPIGALIFGWLGDHIGRKSTIILTTMIMCVSCIVMAILPTYAQIGIAATWIITLCRIAQGMSTMGEGIGAQIYLTESIRRPACYPAVGSLSVACGLGSMGALGVGALVTSISLNWRYAFLGGAVIAFVGAFARVRLRETPDFLEMKRQQIKNLKAQCDTSDDEDLSLRFLKALKETNPAQHLEKIIEFRKQTRESVKETVRDWKGGVKLRTFLSYMLIHCGWPLTFYLTFIYFNPLLRQNFGYSPEDIIRHNFYLSIVLLISNVSWALLGYRIYPLKLLKTRGVSTLILMIALPFLIANLTSALQLFFIQALLLLVLLGDVPAAPILLNRFPVFRRFTSASILFAFGQAVMNIITAFGLVSLGRYFGTFGLWLITLPVTAAFLYAVFHFEWLDRETARELQKEWEEDRLSYGT